MAKSVLMYGRTRAGKTTQIGALAESIFAKTGKKTRLYTTDRGGIGPITPYVELGVVEVVSKDDSDPWIFMNNACSGHVRDDKGGWSKDDHNNIGMFAYESMTAFADEFMTFLADQSAKGGSFGGASNVSFQVQGDGQALKIGGSNMAHYNIVQTRIRNEVWRSQRLLPEDNDAVVLWTASMSKDDDQTSSGKVLGPEVVGKAMTAEVPRWFNYTFRIDAIPAQAGKTERHVLYLGNSLDLSAGNAVSLGNTRTPLDAPDLPSTIEPASLVKALEMIDGSSDKAMEKIKERLKGKLK